MKEYFESFNKFIFELHPCSTALELCILLQLKPLAIRNIEISVGSLMSGFLLVT